jgi:hypothetical protein
MFRLSSARRFQDPLSRAAGATGKKAETMGDLFGSKGSKLVGSAGRRGNGYVPFTRRDFAIIGGCCVVVACSAFGVWYTQELDRQRRHRAIAKDIEFEKWRRSELDKKGEIVLTDGGTGNLGIRGERNGFSAAALDTDEGFAQDYLTANKNHADVNAAYKTIATNQADVKKEQDKRRKLGALTGSVTSPATDTTYNSTYNGAGDDGDGELVMVCGDCYKEMDPHTPARCSVTGKLHS